MTHARVPRRSARGFSLLEVLVVMAIVGIIAGAAALGFGARKDPLREEAKRLYDQTQLVREDAVLQDRQFGLEVLEDADGRYRYRWLEYHSGSDRWLHSRKNGLQARQLPSGVRLALNVEDESVALSDRERQELEEQDEERKREDENTDEGWPQVFFLSSGEVTPFRMYFRRDYEDGGEREILLEGDMIGRIKLHREEE